MYFKKVKGEAQDYVIVYEHGEFQKPLLILYDTDIKNLNEEWSKKK